MTDLGKFPERHPFIVPGETKRIEDNSMGFKHCSEIIIEEGVEEIGGWAFTCSAVDKATIPSSVRKIEENPFPHTHICNVICHSPYYMVKDSILIEKDTMRLVSFVGVDRYNGERLSEKKSTDKEISKKYEYTIPSYIKIVGEGCFRGRTLDKIIIPQTIEKILQNPFVECDAEIVNYSPNYTLEKGLLIENATNSLIAYVGKDKDIVIPEGIEIIEGSAFELLEYGINSITLPSTIREIRDNFGIDCDLQNIYVPIDKKFFIQGLLPTYKKIIKVIGVKKSESNSQNTINMDTTDERQMHKVKQSFISNIIGRKTYDEFRDLAKIIIAIGTCVLTILLLLSVFFHWSLISSLLNLVTGTSLLFIAYIAAFILVLDIEVDVDEPEKKTKPTAYKLTIVWGVLLIALGICAIYFSNKYRKHYAFECETFLVDHQAGIYHLNCDNDCEVASEASNLEKKQGYQIDKSYNLCEWCEEWAEDAEDEYESSRYYRR